MEVSGSKAAASITPNFAVAQSKDKNNELNFKDFLLNAVDHVNKLQMEAQQTTAKLASGQIDNLHEVMIAVEKADIALQFAVQVRNKIIDAYNEVMRMQI